MPASGAGIHDPTGDDVVGVLGMPNAREGLGPAMTNMPQSLFPAAYCLLPTPALEIPTAAAIVAHMVKLNRIYTKTGDAGTTGLGDGARVPKHDLRVEAYGTVDETNAALGLARLHTAADPEMDAILARIQNDLFDLGADLCTPDRGTPLPYTPLRIVEVQVERLEAEIDAMNARLKPLRSFVLPGGSPAAAYLHLARTLARRAERQMCHLAATPGEPVGTAALKYINRLSDLLFVLSRNANDDGARDVLWVPGLTHAKPAAE